MLIRFVIGAVLSAVVLFLWGFVYWTLSPFSSQVIQPLPASDIVGATLSEHVGHSGVFFMPAPPSDMTDEAALADYTERHRQGPIMMAFYQQEGTEPMSEMTMIKGFVHAFVVSLIAGILLFAAAPRTYPNRVMLVLWAGAFCTVWAHVSEVIWYHYPLNFCLLQMGYHIVGGLLVGLVMAAFVRPTE